MCVKLSYLPISTLQREFVSMAMNMIGLNHDNVVGPLFSLSLSLSLSLTHTHTHTHFFSPPLSPSFIFAYFIFSFPFPLIYFFGSLGAIDPLGWRVHVGAALAYCVRVCALRRPVFHRQGITIGKRTHTHTHTHTHTKEAKSAFNQSLIPTLVFVVILPTTDVWRETARTYTAGEIQTDASDHRGCTLHPFQGAVIILFVCFGYCTNRKSVFWFQKQNHTVSNQRRFFFRSVSSTWTSQHATASCTPITQ